jgi:hypothetical protein
MKRGKSSCLCSNCEGLVFGLLNELRNQAKNSNRGGLILDCIGDLQSALENGDIEDVKLRDAKWIAGNRKTGRKLR